MYERSAIVLERYFEEIFGLNVKNNVRQNYQNFCSLIEEIKKYQTILSEEEKIIKEFDEKANAIQDIQKAQEKLYKANIKLEEEREQQFNDLDENPNLIEKKLEKIETAIEKNNIQLKDLKIEFIDALNNFNDKKKERNEFTRNRRDEENNYLDCIRNANENFSSIDIERIQQIKEFLSSEKSDMEKELNELMQKNGKNEKVPFNESVMQRAVKMRFDLAEKEAECYIIVYEKMKRLIIEIDNDNVKLAKYLKSIRDIGIKMAFIEAEKEYIVAFLDNERMTVISGAQVHNKLMEDACALYDLDMIQINNLYNLIQKEVEGKPTKKGYKELYNIEYLENIEDKEKNFEEEIDSIKINKATVINPNYWRIEGIKNIYTVFQEELKEKFQKDLSEYNIVKLEETEQQKDFDEESNKKSGSKSILSEEYEFDDERDFEDEDNFEDDEDNETENDKINEFDHEDEFEYVYDENDDSYEFDDEEDDEEYDDDDNDEDYYDDEDDNDDGESDEDLEDYDFDDEDEEDDDNDEDDKDEDTIQEETNDIEKVLKKIEDNENETQGKRKEKNKKLFPDHSLRDLTPSALCVIHMHSLLHVWPDPHTRFPEKSVTQTHNPLI